MSDCGNWWAIEKFCREESITRPRTPGPGDRWLLAEHAFHKRGRAYSKTPLGWWERAWAWGATHLGHRGPPFLGGNLQRQPLEMRT